MITFPLAAVGDVTAAILIVIAIVSGIVNFFKEKNAKFAAEERQRERRDDAQPAVQSEIESFLDEIGAKQPSTNLNEQRQSEIQERQAQQREQLRLRQQERRQQLQAQQQQRQAAQQQQQRPPQPLPQTKRKRPAQQPAQGRRREALVVTESDFIEEGSNASFAKVSDRHVQSAVVQRHVQSSVQTRQLQSEVAKTHKSKVKLKGAKKLPVAMLLANRQSIRDAIVINEILSRPKSLR